MVDFLPLLVLAGLWVAFLSAFISALRVPDWQWEGAAQSKGLTLVGIAFTCGIGGLYYWLRVKPELRAVPDVAAPPVPPERRKPSPWDDGLGPR